MKLYVGITDKDWFRFLRANVAVEMNFWHPNSTMEFKRISPGELFLFKLKFPENKIVGGAYFVRHSVLPLSLAWDVFGEANGCISRDVLLKKITSFRADDERDPKIGCTTLTDPFYLPDTEFLDAPSDWSKNIVTGKTYDISVGEGARLFEQAKIAMHMRRDLNAIKAAEDLPRFGAETLMRPRLGQGGFRIVVLEGYDRRCAITGERTLPVLEAAHIQPFAENGPHDISNGLLLRSDFHTLFDRGYITLSDDLHINVSRRIKEEFSNGREYYAYHGKPLSILPKNDSERPAKAFLEWHQGKFLGS